MATQKQIDQTLQYRRDMTALELLMHLKVDPKNIESVRQYLAFKRDHGRVETKELLSIITEMAERGQFPDAEVEPVSVDDVWKLDVLRENVSHALQALTREESRNTDAQKEAAVAAEVARNAQHAENNARDRYLDTRYELQMAELRKAMHDIVTRRDDIDR